MPDAARDEAVPISARELAGIGTGIRVRGTIGISFQGDGGYGDDRECGKPLFQIIIFGLAFRQPSRQR